MVCQYILLKYNFLENIHRDNNIYGLFCYDLCLVSTKNFSLKFSLYFILILVYVHARYNCQLVSHVQLVIGVKDQSVLNHSS